MGIKIKNLKKFYGRNEVLKNINIEFMNPGVYLIAGPNGSGKTTLLEIIIGLRKQTSGELIINNFTHNSIEVRRELGFLLQQNSLRKNCYVNEELELVSQLFGVKNVNLYEYLGKYGLLQYYKYKTRRLSGGTKRRLLLAMTLLANQNIIVLDEPVSGLDSFSRNEIWNIISEVSKNRIVIISDHYLNQAAQYADYVYLLDRGSVVLHGDVRKIISSLDKTHVIKVRKDMHQELEKLLTSLNFEIDVKISGTVYSYYIKNTANTPISSINNNQYRMSPIDFEDIYFYYTERYSYNGDDNNE